MKMTPEQKKARAQERKRRAEVLTHATLEGYRSGVGGETAILCFDCKKPMLILRSERTGITRCTTCGFEEFVRKPARALAKEKAVAELTALANLVRAFEASPTADGYTLPTHQEWAKIVDAARAALAKAGA